MSVYVKHELNLNEVKTFLNENKVLIAKSTRENKALYQRVNCKLNVVYYQIEHNGVIIHEHYTLGDMVEKYNSIGA